MSAHCRACPAEIVWATMKTSGSHMPLDAGHCLNREMNVKWALETGLGANQKLVIFNPKTGGGTMLTRANVEEAAKWVEAGCTVHTSHFATCPKRGQFKKGADASQDELGPSQRSSATSQAAAVSNMPRSGTQRARVLAAVLCEGDAGMTRDEIAVKLDLPLAMGRVCEVSSRNLSRISSTTRGQTTREGKAAAVLIEHPELAASSAA